MVLERRDEEKRGKGMMEGVNVWWSPGVHICLGNSLAGYCTAFCIRQKIGDAKTLVRITLKSNISRLSTLPR